MKKHLLRLFVYFLAAACAHAQPLRLLPQNPHYFQYQGKPTVLVGSGEHYGAVMNLDFNYDLYLKTLHDEGLNTTRLFMGAYYEKPGAFGIAKNTMAPAENRLALPWEKTGSQYDLTAWNAAYFERLQDFMLKAERAGVIVEINLFSAYYGSGWDYHPFQSKNNVNHTPAGLTGSQANTPDNGSLLQFQELYVRKLVQQLNRYDNFYFEIQNEPWADQKDTVLVWNDYIGREDLQPAWLYWKNTLEITSEKSRAWQQTVSGWIADEERQLAKKHLVSQNIANFKQPVFRNDPNISIYTFHYAHPDAVGMNFNVNKVIGFNETGFAGRADDTYRRQAWRFMFSGGGLFNHLDYSFSLGHEDGSDTTNVAPGGGSPALRKYFGILHRYLSGLELASLRPDTTFPGHVEGAFSYPMKDARGRVIYLEHLSARPAVLSLQLPQGRYAAEWTDVRTGAVIKAETVAAGTRKTVLNGPAGAGDVVVKITRKP